MSNKVRPSDVKLIDLRNHFNLQFIRDATFFPEWQTDLLELSEQEKESMDKVQAGYMNLLEYSSPIEDTVKLVVLSPLLHAANFFLYPLLVESEHPVQLSDKDDEIHLEGKIDVLVLKEQFWMMVIESKRPSYSIEAGLAQILAYMLANPNSEQPCYGMITTGGSFVFIKMIKGESPRYSISRIFELRNPGNELYEVLGILKRLEAVVFQSDSLPLN